MPKGLKIITAAVLIAVGLASMGMIGLRDSTRRPEYCAQCHVMEPYYRSWQSSDYLAHDHAEFAIPCQTCHPTTMGDSLREIVTYARGKYNTPLKEQEFPKESCLRCHEHGSYEQLIELTKDYTVDGQQINPHAYKVDPQAPDPDAYTVDPQAPDPHDSEQAELECNQCHKIHKESPGLTSCYQCHHDALFLQCSLCHKDDKIAFSEQEFPEESCGRCHDYESTEQLIALTQDYTVNGEPINPHAYPVDPEAPEPEAYLEPEFYDPEAPNPHDTERGELECYPCHKNIEESSLDSCYECHHDAIFTVRCGVCHKE